MQLVAIRGKPDSTVGTVFPRLSTINDSNSVIGFSLFSILQPRHLLFNLCFQFTGLFKQVVQAAGKPLHLFRKLLRGNIHILDFDIKGHSD